MGKSIVFCLIILVQSFIGAELISQTSILRFGCLTYENGIYKAEVIFENTSGNACAGFQFDIQNAILDTASGGAQHTLNWSSFFNPTYTSTSGRVLAFAFGPPHIPADTSVVIEIYFTPIMDSTTICLTGIVMSDPAANAINTIAGPCLPIIDLEKITAFSDTIVCHQDTISLGCDNCDSFPANYIWSPNSLLNNPNNISPTYNSDQGDQLFVMNLINECDDTIFTDSVQVNVVDVSLNASPDTLVCSGTPINLSNTPSKHGHSIAWQNDALLTIIDSSSASATLTASHTFFISSVFCQIMDSIHINVIDCSDSSYFIPNAFSPNNDQINDKFIIRGSNIDKIELYIYNRLGELVFQTKDPTQGWDGTFNGAEVNNDVYIYILKLTFLNNESKEIYGNLTLVR